MADAPPPLPKGEREKSLREGAARYASLAATLGATADEAGRELSAAWRDLTGGKGTRR